MGTVALGRLRLVAALRGASCPGCTSEAQREQLSAVGEVLTALWEALRAGDPVTGAELRGTLRDGLEALAAYERGVAAAQGPAALAAYDRARGPRRDA